MVVSVHPEWPLYVLLGLPLVLSACTPGTIELGPAARTVARADTDAVADTDTDTDTDTDADTDTDTDTDDTGVEPVFDVDGDGSVATVDCDDGDASVYPGASERCDGVDQDCDGEVDEDAVDERPWYADADADGYGDPDVVAQACEAPRGFVGDAGDCNDAAAAVHPDASERCNLVDEDCDGMVDDDPIDAPTWYADADGDRYGDASSPMTSCSVPAGYLVDGTDCDDGSADVHPGSSAWLTAPRGDGTYDADCDGVETQEYTHVSTTGAWGGCCWDAGWENAVPACGVTAIWINSSGSGFFVTQGCR